MNTGEYSTRPSLWMSGNRFRSGRRRPLPPAVPGGSEAVMGSRGEADMMVIGSAYVERLGMLERAWIAVGPLCSLRVKQPSCLTPISRASWPTGRYLRILGSALNTALARRYSEAESYSPDALVQTVRRVLPTVRRHPGYRVHRPPRQPFWGKDKGSPRPVSIQVPAWSEKASAVRDRGGISMCGPAQFSTTGITFAKLSYRRQSKKPYRRTNTMDLPC